MSKIEPTVGRIVWFRAHSSDSAAIREALAAIVTHVNSNNSVNLAVFDAHGGVSARTSVSLVQDGDKAPTDASYAEWPTKNDSTTVEAPVLPKSKTEETTSTNAPVNPTTQLSAETPSANSSSGSTSVTSPAAASTATATTNPPAVAPFTPAPATPIAPVTPTPVSPVAPSPAPAV